MCFVVPIQNLEAPFRMANIEFLTGDILIPKLVKVQICYGYIKF
jgi:hypothetical protein